MHSTVQSILNMKELRPMRSNGLEIPCQNRASLFHGTERNGTDRITSLFHGTERTRARTRVRLQRCREAHVATVHLTSRGQKRKDWREHIYPALPLSTSPGTGIANNLNKTLYMNEAENCYIAGMTEHKNTV